MASGTHGFSEGDVCGRNGCEGAIETHPVENCSCHIDPPCFACTEIREFCPVCDWQAADDPLVVRAEGAITFYGDGFTSIERVRRVLDPTKIDYTISLHTSSSQKVVGVYPEGTTRDQVRAVVNGTFGGRFEKFRDGHFTFIAYTD